MGKKIWILLGILTMGCFLYFVGVVLVLSRDLPDDDKIRARLRPDAVALASEVFDRTGEKIGEFRKIQRYYIPIETIPKHVLQAFLCAEDQYFYEHDGVDPIAVLRAVLVNLQHMSIRQGASTISQQLVRMLFLSRERSFRRKIQEALLAYRIEDMSSKDQILELYLNQVFLGNHSYGVESASRNYFRKSVSHLNIGEAAMLAGLAQAPSRLAPHRNYAKAKDRQSEVLRRMVQNGELSHGEGQYWRKQPLSIAKTHVPTNNRAPYVLNAIWSEIMRKFETRNLPKRGLKIYTSLDAGLQTHVAQNIDRELLSKSHPDLRAAAISVDPYTGGVLALQGGVSFEVSQFDFVRRGRRPLGSLFIPVSMSLALDQGYTLIDRVDDDLMGGGHPANPGSSTLYRALLENDRHAAAHLPVRLGIGSIHQYARRLGLDFLQTDLSLALGYGRQSLWNVVQSYCAFWNGGRRPEIYLIEKITTHDGSLVYARQPGTMSRAIGPQTAFIMRTAFEHVAEFGYGKQLNVTASATVGGTTAELHDAWFLGAKNQLISAVWLGANRGQTRLAADEAKALALAGRTWARLVRKHPSSGRRAFPAPPRTSYARVKNALGAVGVARTLPFRNRDLERVVAF